MPLCALVAQGANRCLPPPVAFCEAAPPSPPPLISCVSLAVTVYVLAYFPCWFSVGKCQVKFCLRGFWQMGWSTNDGGGVRQTQAQSTKSARLYDCQCVCASLFAVMHRYVYAWARLCLESHKRHQSCRSICITSKNRGHAMLIYYLPIHIVWRKLMQCSSQRLLLLK